ncbi:MAG TPA: Cro/CI family transcriptional regulator [Rhizomicrobium sp.]|nr:Cro/CI family transcriptional regulator [Rhizomicrobium sp.]
MPEKPKEIGALRQAIRHHLKSQVAVARAVGVSPQAVSEILRRGRRVPAEWCLAIETATCGAVTRHDLRPDLYPDSSLGNKENKP